MNDARGRYLASRLVDFFSVEDAAFSLAKVEECFQEEATHQVLMNFFKGQGPHVLLWICQPEVDNGAPRLKLLQKVEKLTRRLVYAIRNTGPGKPVNLKEVDMLQEISVGSVEPDFIKHLEEVLSQLFSPLLGASKTWGKCPEKDREGFLVTITKYLENMNELLESTPQCITLSKPPAALVTQITTGPNAIPKAAQDPRVMQQVDQTVESWIATLDSFLREKEEYAGSEPQNIPETIGPLTELEYWKGRFSKVESVLEQLSTPEFKAVVAVQTAAQGRNSKWQALEASLTEAMNEARDNMKYLLTLEKYMEPLYHGKPEDIMEIIPGFVSNIRMMYSIARYYGTAEHMTTLFIKMTNQMIVNCKNTIKAEGRLWEQALEMGLLDHLLKNLHKCIALNTIYQEEYRKAKETLGQNPLGKQFDFNELHIFGKFELFCKRIQKLIDVFTTIEQFMSLSQYNIDGMESLITRFFEIVDDLKRKTGDLLDYTKPTFDKDYIEFNKNIQELESSLQVFINSSFENITSTINALKLLKKFQSILKRETLRADLESKYMVIFHNYGLDLENVQKMYERHKQSPPSLRNWPPISSNITWSQQLLRRIEEPMNKFQQNAIIMSNQKESKKIIKSYNKIARALVEYEAIWLNAWKQSISNCRAGLAATLIVRDQGKLYVNFDMEIFQLIRECKCLLLIGIKLPEAPRMVLMQATKLKMFYTQLTHALKEYDRVVGMINPVTQALMLPNIQALDKLVYPGETILTWQSLNIDGYLAKLAVGVSRLEELVQKVNGIIDNRVQSNLRMISKTLLVHLPEDESFSLDQFVRLQESYIKEQSEFINVKNIEVQNATQDVIHAITMAQQDDGIKAVIPPDEVKKLMLHFNRLMFKAILTTTTRSLNLIKKRVGTRSRHGFMLVDKPFFDVSVELHAPHVMLNPSLDEVQSAINTAATEVLRCSKYIKQWDGLSNMSFFEEIAKNKEIVKVVLLLTGGMHGLKKQVMDYVDSFKRYEYLWLQDKEQAYKEFLAGNPSLEDFENELKRYMNLEIEIGQITSSYTIGSLSLQTTHLKTALKKEAMEWKAQYAKNLHIQARSNLENILFEMEENEKLLAAPITDNLADLRVLMDALRDIRERESEVEIKFSPVEATYQLLDKYEVDVAKDEFDKVSDMRFKWKKLRQMANERNDQISQLQGGFKRDLIAQVGRFAQEVVQFRKQFETHGPMVAGISPQEAMERLKKYQRLYDDKERKWDTYMAGEDLFGLPQNNYPELRKTKKELELLEKLYTLYIVVIQKVNGYADLLWTELDFQQITEEVVSYQNQIKKLPKSLRDWEAYLELKQTVDDFLELQPVLELLAVPAVKDRHWKEIMKISGCQWRLDADLFKLQNILDAKLLRFKDDVEDIALSSVKEADIENKKNTIAADWEDRELVFGEFKHRGPLVLKGEDTNITREQLEESQLQIGSMLASRYVAPFREEVQGWMAKLTEVSENIALWLEVQATWMYLEAVFAGGDIMKQLPQEAKRFAMIDKQWVKIMTKAGEIKNVVGFCYQNELLATLPYLRDQLDACQRQLSAYLEQKRTAFPRFYFVSDGVLLEILSQASDPQAIQPHMESLFDGIASVVFEKAKATDKHPACLRIMKMISQEGEEVKMATPVPAFGNVEDWLNKLCSEVMFSIKEIVRQMAVECMNITNNVSVLRTLIDGYPAQVTLLGLQFQWTADVQSAISVSKSESKKAISETGKRILGVTNELTNITRMDLTKMKRTNVETLITIQVHQQEVWEQTVKKVRDPANFDWQKQARFYWKQERDTAITSIADADTEYCYEYLGVKERLVVTPLTDRCYITLSQALAMYLGGAPAGPAGTGKTETTKDLGRTFGKYVVVFNCSDQLDFRAMGKIYKGLAQSGAWGCFDEFNRIDLPVLSVCAQQVACILTALKQHKSEFIFTDGCLSKLLPSVGFFITMNPGYAGRQELPENLKVLFRGVSMMVPDRRAIMKVKLAAAGYKENDILSLKFFLCYGLCEQQLSKQRHYDFGLRNILSVLRTAGGVLRTSTVKDELFLFMRTLRDMNMSKLVFDDIELFISLLGDLFPGLTADKAKYDKLEAILERVITKDMALINWPNWTAKVVQLYETKLVRHGIMVVGYAGGGKSACYESLLRTLSEYERAHKEFRMNPKAITAPQMFGRMDVTGDWHDGIFSHLWRKANKDKSRNIWIICDGPVDAIWIENLNTVLDDNKLLTLANGDRISMSSTVKCCFEPESLANASPATVSRAGIIFISSAELVWQPVLQALMNRATSSHADKELDGVRVPQQVADWVMPLFTAHVDKSWTFIKNECVIIMNTSLNHMVTNCFYLFCGILDDMQKNGCDFNQPVVKRMFWFCLSWSLAGMLEKRDRDKFDSFVRQQQPDLPESDSIFEYRLEVKSGNWSHWNDYIPSWTYPGDDKLEFSTLFISTLDSSRLLYLMECSFIQKRAVLLMGGAGTAKTVTIEQFLTAYAQRPDQDLFTWKKSNFSSATTPGLFQSVVEDVIEKRMGTTYGPKRNMRMCLFVDDLNMPEINEWGDQITNEIVRQVIEMRGMYSLDKPGEFKTLVDLQYMGAMSHPTGGKNDIPNRLKRHFTIYNVPLPTDISLQQIFGVIFSGRFQQADKKEGPHYSREVVEVAEKCTAGMITFWKRISARMLPTPAKFHYIFNVRDLSRISQGMMMSCKEVIRDPQTLVNLFKSECCRVFSDKLNQVEDKIWYDKAIQQCVAETFGDELAHQCQANTYWVNFLREPVLDPDTGEEIEAAPIIYEPVDSVEALRNRLLAGQKQYNDFNKVRKLDLVLFDMAVKHIVRITRTLSMARGSIMLVGVGGSGKQSLTRLSSFTVGQHAFQITVTKTYGVNNFFDDLRSQYFATIKSGITFIFTDNEIKQERFLEYINNFLSSGEVPGLFGSDDRDSAFNDIRPIAKKERPKEFNDTPDYLWKYFINRVRDRLHFVLCFSPVGDKFRTRARKFPGLIAYCTINWFFPWPNEALLDVATKFLEPYEMETDAKTKTALYGFVANIHSIVTDSTTEYFQRFRKAVYCTPKSYLGFIDLYRNIYKEKVDGINLLADKINGGLQKLQQAGEDVRLMKIDLAQKEVKLVAAQKETDILLVEITESTAKAEKKKAEVTAVKDVLASEASVVAAGKADAEKDLAAAGPALEDAKSALDSITPSDMKTLKALAKPPELIKRIFDGVVLLMQLPMDPNPVYYEVVKGSKMLTSSWETAGKPLLSRLDFLNMLLEFNGPKKDEINGETCELLLPYLWMQEFTYERAKSACGNVAGLCTWVRAMHTYYHIARFVAPKIEALREAEGKLRIANAKLGEKERELAKVEADLGECQARLDGAKRTKQELQDDADRCKKRMDAANGLIEALSGERDRWTVQSNEFKDMTRRLVGDVALAGAFISYCGPFNAEFRKLLFSNYFYQDCIKRKIPVTEDLSVVKFLVDESQITDWQIEGLPSDDHSVQNGIIITRTTKYPLLVDPQGQGLQWLRVKEEHNGVKVSNFTDKHFPDHLRDQLRDGRPLLIENCTEEIDPMLDPVLEKSVVKSGRSLVIIINDKPHDFNEDFKMVMTSMLPNPAFPPELFAKCSIIDFTVTMAGLEQQLLGRVIGQEKAELEEERAKLVEEVNNNEKRLKYYEDKLLACLSASKGNLIDDEELIATLADAKKASTEIKEKLSIAVETRKRINSAREEYRPVAIRGSVLYFLIVEMSLVNPMYQTSLNQFLGLYDGGIEKSERHQLTSKRIQAIIDTMTEVVFLYIGRGLFEEHKTMFALLMACKIELRAGNLTHTSFQTLLKGGAALNLSDVRPKPFMWIPDKAWLNVIALADSVKTFKMVPDLIQRNDQMWRYWWDQEAPEAQKIPDIDDRLDAFERMLLVRSFREDRTLLSALDYIKITLGPMYAEPQQLDLEPVVDETHGLMPTLFLLSQGSDPTGQIEGMAKKRKKKISAISMGQGQEPAAHALVQHGFASGDWVLCQNCHLGLPFLKELLEVLIKMDRANVHDEFRLWITAEPTPLFPIGLLQMSIKLTNEPPQGMRAGILRSYSWMSQDLFDNFRRVEWRPMLYTLCHLHSVVQERRKFGPIGWCIPYEYNFGDWSASCQFVQNHLTMLGDDPKKGVPVSWDTVRYMIAEIQYGGRVTDNKDRVLLATLTEVFMAPRILTPDFKFCPRYQIPRFEEILKHREFIAENMPEVDTPEVFGLHSNADITYRLRQAASVLGTILDIQPRQSSGGGGLSREEQVVILADDLLKKLPSAWNKDHVKECMVKIGHRQPLNIFASQEVDRLQVVIVLVKRTLQDLKLAIAGTIVMSAELQEALDNLVDARVPPRWVNVSWPAPNMGLWFAELVKRHEQLNDWVLHDRPAKYWLTGFFNPQGFLTSVRQEVCRAHSRDGWSLDGMETKSDVLKQEKHEIDRGASEGVYIYGLFLEGCSWDKNKQKLKESAPKEMVKELPVVHVTGIEASHRQAKKKGEMNKFKCPVYKYPSRNDINWIFDCDLNSEEEVHHWIMRGCCLLCTVD
eukprot:EG_transcript_5